PGQKKIGVAISDPTGTIAKPLTILKHVSRPIDAAVVAQLAVENEVGLIIVGQSTDMDGKPNISGRRATRLAAAIRTQTDIPVELWDESYSTKDAQRAQKILGIRPKDRSGHIDEIAAQIILQSYINDTKKPF
ncbi:MAG: Holliday junction resolvase RuvX, partial [Chloroflexota bacterium]